jgi:hypothetical protein
MKLLQLTAKRIIFLPGLPPVDLAIYKYAVIPKEMLL